MPADTMARVTRARAPLGAGVAGRRPRYLEVADRIVNDITSGQLAPGRRLASERELCERLSVSRDTLRKAFATLADAGYISPSPRRGWFVSAGGYSEPITGSLGFTEWATAEGLPTTSHVVTAQPRRPSPDEAAALGIAAAERVFELERVRLINDVPLALDRSVLVLARAPFLLDVDLASASLYSSLRERAGIQPTWSEWEARATLADERVAALLDVDVGSPLLSVTERVFDEAGVPFEYAHFANRGDLYRYRTIRRMRAEPAAMTRS
jgi:GntR family transcriptional regulator